MASHYRSKNNVWTCSLRNKLHAGFNELFPIVQCADKININGVQQYKTLQHDVAQYSFVPKVVYLTHL